MIRKLGQSVTRCATQNMHSLHDNVTNLLNNIGYIYRKEKSPLFMFYIMNLYYRAGRKVNLASNQKVEMCSEKEMPGSGLRGAFDSVANGWFFS